MIREKDTRFSFLSLQAIFTYIQLQHTVQDNCPVLLCYLAVEKKFCTLKNKEGQFCGSYLDILGQCFLNSPSPQEACSLLKIMEDLKSAFVSIDYINQHLPYKNLNWHIHHH